MHWRVLAALSFLYFSAAVHVAAADVALSAGPAEARCARGPEPARSASPRSPGNQRHTEGGVLVIVPGIADGKRAALVRDTIRTLSPRGCIAFTHLRCGDDPELDEAFDAKVDSSLALECEVVRAANGAGGGYVAHLKRVLPSFVEMGGFEWVFVLLDDVALPPRSFSLSRMLSIARYNNLTTVSPAVQFAHDEIMQPKTETLPPGAVGRVVKRVEVFALALTPAAFRCWYDLIDTALNSVGWGYDHWLYTFCKGWRSLAYKAGIVDVLVGVHGGQAKSVENISASAFFRSYGSREAKEAKETMRADFKRRGMPVLHPVDRLPHGWLYDPGAPNGRAAGR